MNNEKLVFTIQDLETRSEEIRELCHKLKQPIFIQRDGKVDLVLMSIEYYKEQRFDQIWPIPAEIDRQV